MSADVDQNWGPQVEQRSRRKRWPRILAAVLILALIAAVAYPWWLSQQVARIDVGELAGSGGPLHILVTGSDSREDLSAEQRVELGTGTAEGERTDTIFVLSIQGGEVALLSFPRDLWVRRCDGSMGRINAATAIGGPDCLVRTVRDVSGIPINHYLEMTFAGFRDLVDAVGGVELCLDEPISDRDAHIDLPAGCQRLDGLDALGYVRVRKIDNDLMRIQRQQAFVQALAAEIASVDTLLNPVRLTELARDSGEAVRVDRSMGPIDMARIAFGLRGLGQGRTLRATVPTDPRTTSAGAQVLDLRVGEAEPLFEAFRSGSVFDRIEAPSDSPAQVSPEDVQVAVLNGAGVGGLAGSVGENLEAEGFEVVGIGNAERRNTTEIRHAPGDAAAARLVAGAVPGGGTLREDPEATTVTVVLGADAGGIT